MIVDLSGHIRKPDDERKLKELIEGALSSPSERIALNMAGSRSINSSGLGRLAIFSKDARAHGSELVLYNLSPELKELFAMTMLDMKIKIAESEGDIEANLSADLLADKPA